MCLRVVAFKSIFAALPSCVMHCRVPALLGFAAAAFVCVHAQAIMSQYDVLVYGSTPGGIQAAIAASTEGASVLLVSPSARMGGMKKRLTSAKTARDPDSRINKALRKWNC